MNNKFGTYALSGDQGCDDRILADQVTWGILVVRESLMMIVDTPS